MKVVRHNDIVLYLDHWIVHGDAVQQFLFYHFAYLREVNSRGERVAIRLAHIACYIAKGLLTTIHDTDGDVVKTWPAIVFPAAAPSHMFIRLILFHLRKDRNFFRNFQIIQGKSRASSTLPASNRRWRAAS